MGQVKNIQLAVETGMYLTAVTQPKYPTNPQIDLNKIIEWNFLGMSRTNAPFILTMK